MAAFAAVAVILVVVLLIVGVRYINRAQGAASLRTSILDAAKQCCAVEGSYPSSIQYLEDEYGLRVNNTDYIVTYEAFASNVMPSVVVIPR